MYPNSLRIRFSSENLSAFLFCKIVIVSLPQSKSNLLALRSLSNKSSPHPIAAGKFSSPHLIAICDATPPYFVINPAGEKLKIQSKPGSAFSIKIIELELILGENNSGQNLSKKE